AVITRKRELFVWDLANRASMILSDVQLAPELFAGNCLAFAADGRTLLAGDSRQVTAWDVVSGQRQHTFGAGNDGTATADIAVATDGKTLITFEFPGGGVYRYHVWDAESGKERFTFDWKEEAAAPLLRYMPEGNMVTITTIRGRQTRIWDITTGKERSPI